MSAYTAAQAKNDISRNVRQYRDLDLFFGRKPISKDINILTDVENIKRAVKNLNAKPATLLIDGNHDIGTGLKEICIIKGDKTCKSIAAASIIAKFTRDFILKKISRIYPYYRLEKNKGYGTQEHVDSLRKYGPSPFHRKTFRIKQN